MIIHRTNVARGRRGLFGLLTLLLGDRRGTRWMGCTPQRPAWDDLRAAYLRARQVQRDAESVASIRHTRSWPNDPRVSWTALHRIRRAIAKATAARAPSPTATAPQGAPIPGAHAVAVFSSRRSRAA